MNKVFAVDCSPLFDEEQRRLILPSLDVARRQQVERLATPEKKAQSAAAGWIVTQLFGSNDCSPTLTHGSRGKPYLAGRDDAFFSLSHTGRWVLCAISDKETGLDAQVINSYREAVARRCFTDREIIWCNGNSERFTRLWTAKEAYLKYTGFGFVLPMSSFGVPLPPAGWDEQNKCYWQEMSLEGIRVTLCSGSSAPASEIQILSL